MLKSQAVVNHDSSNRILTNNREFLSLLKFNNQYFTDENCNYENGDDGDDDSKGLIGLNNLGNTCYMNSALQSLLNCPALTNYFLECSGFVRPAKQPHMSLTYMKLVKDVWSPLAHRTKRKPLSPNDIFISIKYINPMFRGFMQQDAQEFLLCFLDQLNEELKQINLSASLQSMQFDHLLNGDDETGNRQTATSEPSDDTDSYETCESSTPTKIKDFLSKYETISGDSGPTIAFSHEKAKSDVETIRSISNSEIAVDSGVSDGTTNGECRRNSTGENQSLSMSTVSNKSANVELDLKLYKKIKKSYTSIISDIFDGKLISQVQCLKCRKISNTIETFQDLSLPIPTKEYLQVLGIYSKVLPQIFVKLNRFLFKFLFKSVNNRTKNKFDDSLQNPGWFSTILSYLKGSFTWGPTISLEDCFSAYFTAADLKGENMYSCETCKKLSDGVKYSKLLFLPETLFVHLKRFRHDYMFSSKISTYVSFPLKNLDLNDYLHRECRNESTLYDLSAVICHHGGSNNGHYTCYAYNYLYSQWYEYDDCYCVQVDEATVRNAQAYVLFYRKFNPKIEQVHRNLATFCLKNEVSTTYFVSKKWLNKLKYFSEPGPITNHDYLCAHGHVLPSLWSSIDDLVVPVTESLWHYLSRIFGSDMCCSSLDSCDQCLFEMKELQKRRQQEKETYLRLQEKQRDLADRHDNSSPVLILWSYAISSTWFKEWESFVLGKTQESNFYDFNHDAWNYLYSIYGGGPTLKYSKVLHKSNHSPIKSSASISYKNNNNNNNNNNNSSSQPSSPAKAQIIKNTKSMSILHIASTLSATNHSPSSSSSLSSYDDCLDNVTLITTPQSFIKIANPNEEMFQIKETRIN